MKFKNLEEVFQAFTNLKVLIVGDVMIDSYLWGKVERISPEAPVPVVHVQKREKRLGGAANVALNIQALGATPVLCSVIGKDSDGTNFLEILESNHMQKGGIIQSKDRITTIKHRILSGSQHMLRIDSEIEDQLSDQEAELLIEKVKKLLPGCQVLIFEDYDKGVLNEKIIKEIVNTANELGIPTVVDPKKKNFLCYENVTLFKPNLKELREGLKIEVDAADKTQVKSGVSQLKAKLKAKSILVTLSEKGVYIVDNKQEKFIPAHKREISDVSGAGDTVTSIAAVSLAIGMPPEFIASLSNLGGGLVCEHVGVVPIDKNDLFREASANKLL